MTTVCGVSRLRGSACRAIAPFAKAVACSPERRWVGGRAIHSRITARRILDVNICWSPAYAAFWRG